LLLWSVTCFLLPNAHEKRLHQRGLTNPRLPGDEDKLAFTTSGFRQPSVKLSEFGLATHQN
jgi:hypothetical protein